MKSLSTGGTRLPIIPPTRDMAAAEISAEAVEDKGDGADQARGEDPEAERVLYIRHDDARQGERQGARGL